MEGYTGSEYDLIDRVLYTPEQIQTKCDELVTRINEDYKDREVIVVCILRGAAIFMGDVCKRLKVSNRQEYISVSSYGGGTESSGSIKINLDFKEEIKGKHVLIIEDIIDTGNCLDHVVSLVKQREAASCEVCVLLDKVKRREKIVSCKYTGFIMEGTEWVVGYGLDFNGWLRSLPFIAALNKEKCC